MVVEVMILLFYLKLDPNEATAPLQMLLPFFLSEIMVMEAAGNDPSKQPPKTGQDPPIPEKRPTCSRLGILGSGPDISTQ